jgi:hypothetical protein
VINTLTLSASIPATEIETTQSTTIVGIPTSASELRVDISLVLFCTTNDEIPLVSASQLDEVNTIVGLTIKTGVTKEASALHTPTGISIVRFCAIDATTVDGAADPAGDDITSVGFDIKIAVTTATSETQFGAEQTV